MAMLDLSMLGGEAPFSGLLNLKGGGGFPDFPKEPTAQEIWDKLEAENAKNNTDSDRRNAAGFSAARIPAITPTFPLPAPDEKTPAIAMAMGQSPTGFGGLGSDKFGGQRVFGSLAPTMPQSGPALPAPIADAQAAIPASSIPMPRARPTVAPQEDDGEPVVASTAQPASSAKPAETDAPAVPESSLFGRLKKGASDNSNLLLGMAAGFAGAPSFGTGMSRGFAGASAGGQLDQKAQQLAVTQNTAKATYDALKAAGAPPQQALVAAFNPESALSKKLIDSYIGDRKGELKNIKLANGTEISVLHNPYTQEVTDLSGKKLDLNNITGASIDQSLTGQAAADAAQAADPALHKRAMALVEGRETWPTGRALNDPKAKAATDLARQIDPQLTEQRALERNQFAKDAGNTGFTKVGGQVKAFHQGIDHALTLARNIEKYQPSGGAGFEPVAGVINSARELTTHQKDLANQIGAGAQTTAGEVGKLFSGNGGGVHERAETAARFKSTNSGPASAGALEATIETMEGGLRSIEANRDRVMGEGGSRAPELQFRNKETDAKIAEIKQIIGRLRGEQAAQSASTAAPLAPGASTIINGVTIRRVN